MNNFSYLVKPGKISGVVKVSGAKNSALRLLAASILFENDVILNNYPNTLLDIKIHEEMLVYLGKEVVSSSGSVIIREKGNLSNTLEWQKRSIRNTLLILGALVSRFGYGAVPLPGGCKLGDRKYDIHVQVLEALGAKVTEKNGFLIAESKTRLSGNEIHLRMRSTGATENAILASCLALGKTNIWNPHIRPEIVDLVGFLNKAGAKIKIHGQERIEVEGVDSLTSIEHNVMADNMEALTWVIATAIAGESIEIEDFPFEHLEVPLIFLRESGIEIFRSENKAIIRKKNVFPIEISTGPYPGINSDMQPLFACLGAVAAGESHIIDLRFPGRYAYSEEMVKMGVETSSDGFQLKIKGTKHIIGSEVNASDLRAGIALLILALVANSETTIHNAWQIERGYDNIVDKFSSLGISIKRISAQ